MAIWGIPRFFARAMRASQRALASSQEQLGLSAFGPRCNISDGDQGRCGLRGGGPGNIVYT